MTTPAAHKTPEDQRRQNRQTKKDESRIDESALNRLHRLRRLDRRNRFAHHPPLNDVRDHEQIQRDQRRRAPSAGLRFADASFAVAGDVDPGSRAPGNPRCFQFPADATTFHRVGEFTPKTPLSQ